MITLEMLSELLVLKSDSYKPYNQLYRITDVAIGSATTVTVAAASSIAAGTIAGAVAGVGATLPIVHTSI